MGDRLSGRDLLARGRYTAALEAVEAVSVDDAGYQAARLIGMEVLLADGRVAEAGTLLEGTDPRAFTAGDDGVLLSLWRTYLVALILPAAFKDPLGHVVAKLDAAVSDPSLSPRCRVEAVGLRARLTQLRVRYAELPQVALREAANEFGSAAAGYRDLGILAEVWRMNGLRSSVLQAIPDEGEAAALELLDATAAEAHVAGDPFAEANARLGALDINLFDQLDRTGTVSLIDISAECAAVGTLLDEAGHAFGQARAMWTVAAPLLHRGSDEMVDAAEQCAEAFADAGASRLEQEVWRALETLHGLRGHGARQRDAQRRAAEAAAGGPGEVGGRRWQMLEQVELIGEAESLFREGQIGRARQVVDTALGIAPHRQARVSLRMMSASQLSALGQPDAARGVLRAALDDLDPVAPTVLSGEVLAHLASLEVLADPAGAIAHATEAVEAAREAGDLPAVGRYLAMRALLCVQSRFAAGQRPVVTAGALNDLSDAAAQLTPLTTVDGRRALISVYQTRGQAAVFDNDLDTGMRFLEGAVQVARTARLVPDLAFALSQIGAVGTQRARQLNDVAIFDEAGVALREACHLFESADMSQVAWRARFLMANTQWEAALLDLDQEASALRMERARADLEQAAGELDLLRGAAGGGNEVERQLSGMSFGVDKQDVYRTGFHLAVDGLGDPVYSICWLERMKSRSLLDALAAAAIAPTRPQVVDASEAAQTTLLVPRYELEGNSLLAREADLVVLRAQADSFDELTDIECQMDEVLDQLAADERTAGYAALRRSRPPSWDEVQAALTGELERTDRRVVIAQYSYEPGQVMLFGMAPDWPTPRMQRLAVDTDALANYTRMTFRTSGGVRMMEGDSADGGVKEWHRFASLVAPLAEWAAPDDIVYLIPHEALHDLPLHTLPPDPVQPGVALGHRNPLCYAPSLAVMLHTLAKPTGTERTAAVFADPRDNLPWALEEGRAVARSLGASLTTGPAVTRPAVLTALRDAATVHIAGHARASVDDGLAAGIELAGGDMLRAADLLLAPIGASLVVLSGCETGVSQHRPGDEAVGLVRALLHGGTRSMLTSQWRVNDRSARLLLSAFHENATTSTRADALRQAMISVAAQPGMEHFYHWGGFVLVGDWR